MATYIKSGWLIDGSGGPIQHKVLLHVENGSIVAIHEGTDSTPDEPLLVTDLSHCTILPPLVDSHIHLAMSGTINPHFRKQQLEAGYPEIKSLIARHMHNHFTHGVLAVRDGGDRNGYTLRFKKADFSTSNEHIRMKVAGKALHKSDCYGNILGQSCEGDEFLSQTHNLYTDSNDHVKLINSGLNSLRIFGQETTPQYDRNEIRTIVQLAEKKGKKVMVHANGREPVRLALEAGCHSIEHGFFMGTDNLKRMADKQVYWVPTAITMKAAMENMGGDAKRNAEKYLMHQLEQVRRARDLDVPVALGTDSGSLGVLHGESAAEEIKLFVKAGYSLSEAICCATNAGACLLGIDHKMGLLTPGKPANFIVVRGSPEQLPGKLAYIEEIYLEGKPAA